MDTSIPLDTTGEIPKGLMSGSGAVQPCEDISTSTSSISSLEPRGVFLNLDPIGVSYQYTGGALRSPGRDDDYIYEHIATGFLDTELYSVRIPEEYDLRSLGPPARDQKTRGTCAAFAAAYIKEIQEHRDCGFAEEMSPEFIYYHRENKPGIGMYGRNVFQILQKYGSVPESSYPYKSVESSTPPDDSLYKIAGFYRISNYAKVTTLDGVKRALLELGPCYLQLPLYRTRPEFWLPTGSQDRPSGGHAVTIVGYNTTGLILKNSWGPTWNGDGCIVFPYRDWHSHWECWVGVDEKTVVGGWSPGTEKKRKQNCDIS